MKTILSKVFLILIFLLAIFFFIGNYYDEMWQTIDYESYLYSDEPQISHQIKQIFLQNYEIKSPKVSPSTLLIENLNQNHQFHKTKFLTEDIIFSYKPHKTISPPLII
jgi:hypothetical protein